MKICKRDHIYSKEFNQCPKCQKAGKKVYNKAYYENNKDRITATKKVYYENNSEECKARCKKYVKTHPDKYAANAAKRHAQKLQATPGWLTKEQHAEIQEFYTLAQELAWLNQDVQIFHVDHIIPLQGENVCGLHVPWNLQLLTAKENRSKGNRYE